MPTSKSVYQLKVTLNRSKPLIWRRILVPEEFSLYDLHEILQRVMGWEDYHLHMFKIADQIYSGPEDEEYGDLGTKNEMRSRLNKLGLREKAKFSYEYDFGDGWGHTILVEKILPAEPGLHYPVCVTGKRACPPEDVGGIWGYANFLDAISDPTHEEHDDLMEWAGGAFDPEEFDLDEVNEVLKFFKPSRGRRKAQMEPDPENDFGEGLMISSAEEQKAHQEALLNWVQNLGQEQIAAFESLPLRRDMLTFLDYLAMYRTVGTQATGNLPLKAVRDICAKFVAPPVLEETIGDQLYKVRSEDDVWPLFFVHQLAFHSNMVSGGPGQVWQVTDEDRVFLRLAAPVQTFILFLLWWTGIDWTLAFPVSGLEDALPFEFKLAALAGLRELSIGENALYKPFADRLIEQSGLEWHIEDQQSVQSILRMVVDRVLIEPMTKFGILECEYAFENTAGLDYQTLATIRLNRMGKDLLDMMK